MKMRMREIIAVVAYGFLAAFVLEIPGWLPWLGFAIWPVVLLAPVIYALVRYRRPLSHFVVYLSFGLLAELAGWTLALQWQLRNSSLSSSWRSVGVGSAVGVAVYSVPLLALIVTLVALFRSDWRESNKNTSFFNPAGAWLTLVAVFLLTEAFVFGASTKMCGGIDWGLYGIMFSPALLHFMAVRAGTALGIVTALLLGGFLPRFIKLQPKIAVPLFIAVAILVAGVGFAVTPVQDTPCQPV